MTAVIKNTNKQGIFLRKDAFLNNISTPIVAVFIKKGAKFRNVLIFIGAWSITKIPMFLFELSALGGIFANY